MDEEKDKNVDKEKEIEKNDSEQKSSSKVVLIAVVILLILGGIVGGKRILGGIQIPNDMEKIEELLIEDLKEGTGDEAVSGSEVSVHYVGTLTDGTKFDSSRDRGEPFSFPLGAGRVIKGWDQGVVGMKVGGLRKLTIPSDLAYGDRGAGDIIGPGATLVFEVELISVK